MSPRVLTAVLLVARGAGCREEKSAEPLQSLKPEPLPSLASGRATPVDAGPAVEDASPPAESAPVYGEALPEDALRLELAGERVRLGPEAFEAVRPADAARHGRTRVWSSTTCTAAASASTFSMSRAASTELVASKATR